MSDRTSDNLGASMMVLINTFVDEIRKVIATNHDSQNGDMPIVYTPEEVAEKLGISSDTVYKKLLHEPGFPYKRIGRRIVIPVEQFRSWVNE